MGSWVMIYKKPAVVFLLTLIVLSFSSSSVYGQWDLINPPPGSWGWLFGVHFTSASDGWAVGYINGTGLLLHYSGGTWTSVTPPNVSSDWYLNGVHFTSPAEGWAVGRNSEGGRGLLLHYAIWPVTSSSKLSVKGWGNDLNLFYGTCHINPDGTFSLSQIDHGPFKTYTGTYVITPGGKSILFTLDQNGVSAMRSMLTSWVQDLAAEEGVDVQNISFVFDKVSISKGMIQKKTNAPSKVTLKITGTVTALVDGSPMTASFSYQSSIKYYSP